MSEDAGSSEAAAAASAATDGQPAAAAATEQQQEQKRQQQRLVIIWDLDETLLIFNSLLTGTFAAAQRTLEAAERLQALGARWERAILGLCDGQFFFDQVRRRECSAVRALRWCAKAPLDCGLAIPHLPAFHFRLPPVRSLKRLIRPASPMF